MGRKRKLKSSSYDDTRKQLLLKDIEEDERMIKKLSKKLGLLRKTWDESKTKYPLWMREMGLNYLLDFEKEIQQETDKAEKPVVVGQKPKKRKKSEDIYGQNTSVTTSSTSEKRQSVLAALPDSGSSSVSQSDETTVASGSEHNALRRSIRSLLNQVSESHLQRVVTQLSDLFTKHPRAIVRSILIEELCNLLETSPLGSRSHLGWLQQELAACFACVHIQIQLRQYQTHLVIYLAEKIVRQLLKPQEETHFNLQSHVFFLACLFRFNVIACDLIFDILNELVERCVLDLLSAAHFVAIGVGIHLRKSNMNRCQEVIELCKGKLAKLKSDDVELNCELKGIIHRLSEKHSKELCVARLTHLRKLINSIAKTSSFSDQMCPTLRLQDLCNASAANRWWVVGSAVQSLQVESAVPSDAKSEANSTTKPDNVIVTKRITDAAVPPEIETAAAQLGLKTPVRLALFNIICSTPGGPDATASALLKFCSSGQAGSTAMREREAVQLLIHCLISEQPFNRFYPRVLGGLLNHHRRFIMMTKCAFWDVLNKDGMIAVAKSNAGRSVGLLCLVYDFPLTVLKSFNFGDESEGNIAFLHSLVKELCVGEYQKVLSKLAQLSTYTRLSRNFRIFLRKHFAQEENDTLNAYIARLVSDLRESERF